MERYSEVKYEAASGKIEGRTNMGSESYNLNSNPVLFSANIKLLAIRIAMDVESRMIRRFMNEADGYGQRGSFPSGYDWSGIRDSSEASVAKMFEIAKGILGAHEQELLNAGLPQELVNDMIVKRCGKSHYIHGGRESRQCEEYADKVCSKCGNARCEDHDDMGFEEVEGKIVCEECA